MSLTDTQRTTLRLFCDTIVPRIDREPDPHGHWARTATDSLMPFLRCLRVRSLRLTLAR